MSERADISSHMSWLLCMSLGFLLQVMVLDLAIFTDVILFLSLIIFRNRKSLFRLLPVYGLTHTSRIFTIVAGVLIAFVVTKAAQWLRTAPGTTENLTDESPRPLFFPSRTTHTRLFPKCHSFSYSYLLVGIPVGWQGSRGGMLSADCRNHNAKYSLKDKFFNSAWYTVDAGDYLDRGYRYLGLDGKLRKYMESQGIRHEDYPYAYLITAPKFLGYSFNPVSFWYLYSVDRKLAAMILEVNNTFDERHPYFLKQSKGSQNGTDKPENNTPDLETYCTEKSRSDLEVNTDLPTKPMKLTSSWAKEFHVSPFNSRKGTYSLTAYDPLYPLMSGQSLVDNTITLVSSKAHSKLVARIFSEGAPVDPQTMSTGHKLKFLFSWWWIGLVTYPRIIREAIKLFFGRKLHVWFRPEPLKTSISRNADPTEQILEAVFRGYLRYLVKSVASPLVVIYTAAGIVDTSEEKMISASGQEKESQSKILEFKVLTPLFYSRFVHYAHDLEAFHSELNESGTIWLSEPSLLPALVLKRPRPLCCIHSLINYVSFKAIRTLRRRPAPIEAPSNTTHGITHAIAERKKDVRFFRLSAMDGYVLTEVPLEEQRKYRTEVLKLFISDHIALGSVDLFRVELFLLKFLISWALAGSLFAS